MTTEEKLQKIGRIVQEYAPMDRTNGIFMESYPHREGDGFAEREWCVELSATVSSRRVGVICKTLGEAVDRFAEALAEELDRLAAGNREDSSSKAQSAERRERQAAEIRGSVTP